MKTLDFQKSVTRKIIDLLEQGHIPWSKDWASAEQPINLISGKAYRGINNLILSMSEYSSPEWMTYDQAINRGGYVKKKQKGTHICFFKPMERENADGKKERFAVMRNYTVFNIEQTEGIEVERPERREVEPDALLDAIAGIRDRHSIDMGQGKPCYMPGPDRVLMPHVGDFSSNESYAQVAAHEFVHWTGHKSRLNRFKEQDQAFNTFKESYAFEELVAELGASYVSAELGIRSILNHAAYVQSWIKALRNDHKYIFQAASKASKASQFLIGTDDKGEEEKAA